ncbi:redoxin domain-containing protein [Flavobacteriaceae bacterium Ap0902]|nr:redoxin domain-containing protein [Flavobacteriaceae bacterium Ap0902]
MKTFLEKRWKDILLGVFLLMMLIPQTRTPIQVFIQRLIALSPNEVSAEKQKQLIDYNLTFNDKAGNFSSLKDNQGKVMVINFWATWCPPCIAEMPAFSKVYKDYSDRVAFYFITQDNWDVINAFEQKRQYQLPYYKLINPSKDLEYASLPTTYVIDKTGNVLIDKVGVADWNSEKFRKTLDKALNN